MPPLAYARGGRQGGVEVLRTIEVSNRWRNVPKLKGGHAALDVERGVGGVYLEALRQTLEFAVQVCHVLHRIVSPLLRGLVRVNDQAVTSLLCERRRHVSLTVQRRRYEPCSSSR